ncbi:MAG: Uma2 family endonuclease [Labilithrix sp.]|nr:Uma2 family endonuclease [Labilithrix sp.]MCW5811766.1 Uma2 family endonuclease [Labilithrix sp.]
MGAHPIYRVDPADPRAPSDEVWAELSEDERRAIVAALPSEIELGPPEGDTHRIAIEKTKDPLEGFFERLGRRVYISSNLAVYYPNERVFAPDLLAVLDVDPHRREKWVVQDEKRGLDFVLEVNVGGDRAKDFQRNVDLYARLGIAEYFIYDPPRGLIRAFALPSDGRTYDPVLGQQGRFPSRVLGLDLGLEDGVLRFFFNGAIVPETRELLDRAQRLLSDVMAKYDAALRRAEEAEAGREEERRAREEEHRAREEEHRAREAAEERVRELLAENERLRRERDS